MPLAVPFLEAATVAAANDDEAAVGRCRRSLLHQKQHAPMHVKIARQSSDTPGSSTDSSGLSSTLPWHRGTSISQSASIDGRKLAPTSQTDAPAK